jgi:hypothetical protein
MAIRDGLIGRIGLGRRCLAGQFRLYGCAAGRKRLFDFALEGFGTPFQQLTVEFQLDMTRGAQTAVGRQPDFLLKTDLEFQWHEVSLKTVTGLERGVAGTRHIDGGIARTGPNAGAWLGEELKIHLTV